MLHDADVLRPAERIKSDRASFSVPAGLHRAVTSDSAMATACTVVVEGVENFSSGFYKGPPYILPRYETEVYGSTASSDLFIPSP